MSNDPNALAGLVLSYAMRQMKPALDVARKHRNENLVPGEKHAVRHPVTNEVLGFETRTESSPRAQVSELAELLPWMAENHPDDLVDEEENHATDEEIYALVREHLPHRLVPVVRITEQGLNAVLKKAEQDKTFRPPGITVSTATGTTNFYPENADAIESVITDRLISLDGTARPAIPGGEAA